MRRLPGILAFCAVSLLVMIFIGGGFAGEKAAGGDPPFTLKRLEPIPVKAEGAGTETTLFNPRNPFSIFINYELGMHCVGFDISYCCIIPPYNSIQAQAVQAGLHGDRPRLLSPGDGVRLHYAVKDNTYSEGNKMKYWQVLKDVTGTGTMNAPGDNMANYVWTHLFIYRDLEGSLPAKGEEAKRLRVGREIPVNVDSGPSGKPLSGGYMDYAGDKGGNIVFTDSLLPAVRDVPLRLTASYLWDALGLPLTAFNDSRRTGSIRTITDHDFQPYQYALVQLRDAKGNPLVTNGKTIDFFGTEPVDISNCYLCHSANGLAANLSRQSGLTLFDKEYAYWKKNYPDVSEYMARMSSATIGILELHDKHHKTEFLRDYNPDAASNRIGGVGSVNCPDCHGDNMSGNLQSPRPGATGYPVVRAKPLTEAVHAVHARMVPLPDKAGRTQNCQVCHPSHWQDTAMNDLKTNPHAITDESGLPRFTGTDLRAAGGGCYLRRDAHTNPEVKPPFFLNEIGKWYLNEVSMKDENGKPLNTLRGIYCTNCHNHLTHELYAYDDLRNPVIQDGKTLRNRTISEVIQVVAGGNNERFRRFFADPTAGAEGNPLTAYYANHKPAILSRAGKDADGKTTLLTWNAGNGEAVSYAAASGGSDWWLSPGVPHCADCHVAPFVESAGGQYFPLDQPNKYSLYRYSKAHGRIACQSCHESVHGLYPVRYAGPKETVDLTSHEQALQFSPDGNYAGPVTCAACHTVNGKGVPVQLKGTDYYGDYWAAVVLIHFMREGDEKTSLAELVAKYPYRKAREIVAKGWK